MPLARYALLTLLCLTPLGAMASSEGGEETAQAPTGPVISYYALAPDIITNYLSDGKTLGYIRATIELMAESEADKKLLEANDPLIRDAIIRLLGSKTGEQIKSLATREELRKECEAKANELLLKETGKKAIKELIFTKFLYQ